MTNARDKANIPVLNFQSKGIDDNATSTALTINSNETVEITSSEQELLYLNSSHATNCKIKLQGGYHSNLFSQITESAGAFVMDVDPNGQEAGSNFRVKIGGSEKARLNSTGLGIGTSSPTQKLEVIGRILINETSGNGTFIIDGSATSNSQIRFSQGGTPKGYLTYWDSSDTLGLTDGSASGLHFSPSNQRVGIGTSSPGQVLDVVGNAEINGNIYNNGKLNIRKDGASESEHLVITNETGGSNASPTFTDIQFNGVSGKDRARIRVQDQSNNKLGGFMKIQTSGGNTTDGSSFATRIFLDNDGDIFFYEDTGTTAKVKWDATNERFGIGTIAPTQTLDVNGTVKATAFQGDGSALTNLPGGGSVLKVFTKSWKGGSTISGSGSTWTAVSNYVTESITPQSSSSKFIIQWNVSGYADDDHHYFKIMRIIGGTATDIGLASSGLGNNADFAEFGSLVYGRHTNTYPLKTVQLYDAPNTTSAVTYQLYNQSSGATFHFGRSAHNPTNKQYAGQNTCTVWEVDGSNTTITNDASN